MTAESLRRAGNPAAAVDVCRDALIRFPGHLSARVTLGWALLDLGKLREAQHEFETVRRQAPDNLAAIRGLAKLHTLHDEEGFHDGGAVTDDFDPLVEPQPAPSLPPAPVQWSMPPLAIPAPAAAIAANPAGLVEPFELVESFDLAEPFELVEPVGPVGPVEPVEPVGPVGPVGPVEPVFNLELDAFDSGWDVSSTALAAAPARLALTPVVPAAASPPPVVRRLERWLAQVEAQREDRLTECA